MGRQAVLPLRDANRVVSNLKLDEKVLFELERQDEERGSEDRAHGEERVRGQNKSLPRAET